VAQSVQDVYFAMNSVFLGPAERQTIQLDFAGRYIKDPLTNQTLTFPLDTSPLFVAELLDWVDRVASTEGPRLVHEAGKDGIKPFKEIIDPLRKFVRGALLTPRGAQDAHTLPPGYNTPRVQRAFQELADQLDETFKLARPINPPQFSDEPPAGDKL